MKETPSLKVKAFCPNANKKVTYVLSEDEGLLFKCKNCGILIIVASPNFVLCGRCYQPLNPQAYQVKACSKCGFEGIEWYDGWFYTGYRCKRCGSHEYNYKTKYWYLSCPQCGYAFYYIGAQQSYYAPPIKIDEINLMHCNVALSPEEKVELISVTCLYCEVKRYIPGQKIFDIFSAFCKKCGKETDWIESNSCMMCLSCGLILRK